MRTSEAALALITRKNDGGDLEYLAQWNRKWKTYSLVGGHREGDETFRACCIREVEEELEIHHADAFVVSSDPVTSSCDYAAYSESKRRDTDYRIQLFQVDLKPGVQINGDNAWLTEAEILHGVSREKKRVARQVRTVLRICEVIEFPEVHFNNQLKERLSPVVREMVADDLALAFRRLSPGKMPKSLQVVDLFSGYTPNFSRKATVGVEVTFSDSHERHIVKVGARESVEPDYTGWRGCTRGRFVASRIFAPVRMVSLPDARAAVIYRDAFSLFGPEEGHSGKSAPVLLEEAISWSVTDERPDAMSAERAICQIFTDLGTWFYPHSEENRAKAHNFYQRHLQKKIPSGDREVLDVWETDDHCQKLRRHAVWVLCGRDAADADPKEKPARYLDPVEYIRWSQRASDGSRTPPTLVGCAHGDLHARNVLVGVRRGELQYPAGFDYGDMGPDNVLAWDFAKFETELKVRLLPLILCDRPDTKVMDWLLKKSALRRQTAEPVCDGDVKENALRADRLAAFLMFEELIYKLSKCIQGQRSVEYFLERDACTGIEKLDRLAEIILRIRQEAAYWLGFKSLGRQLRWEDELYYALGVYGVMNARWNYTVLQQESALVSAGAALARMPAMPGYLQECIDAEEKCVFAEELRARVPSYRVPLAACHADWKARNHEAGLARTAGPVLVPGPKGLSVVPEMQHAVPLIGHALLFQLEDGELDAAMPLLEQLQAEAATFLDHEMLARIGRLYKDVADRETRNGELLTQARARDPLERPPFLQMYEKSFEAYQQAYDLTDDWYVGINAATLALLSGCDEDAKRIAEGVAKTCAEKLDHTSRDRYWLFATEGEAAIILGRDAVSSYDAALNTLTAGQAGMADSSYRQAIRLWRFLEDGERVVAPVLKLFENSPFKDKLSLEFLGRKDSLIDAGS